MRYFGFAVIGLLMAFASRSPLARAASEAPSTVRDISPWLATIVATRRVPGLAVAVLKGDQIVAEGVAGVRRKGRSDPLSLNDQFLICSATKAMTATLVALAVDEQRLSWSSSVGDVLGSTVPEIRTEWNSATLAQLLEHRGGAPADTAKMWTLVRAEFFTSGSSSKKRAVVIRSVLSHRPAYPPGRGYIYSTLDYLIVDAMLEKAYGRSWESLMQQRLWQPLGIVNAGFGAPEAGRGGEPYGHLGILFPGHAVKPDGFWARLTMPAGFNMARMSISEWARFVALHLRGDSQNPNRQARLLKPESFVALHRLSPEKFYEGGWFRAELPWQGKPANGSLSVLSSQGDNYAWHAEAWLMPLADTAILIACNEGGPTAEKPAARASRDVLYAVRSQYLAGL